MLFLRLALLLNICGQVGSELSTDDLMMYTYDAASVPSLFEISFDGAAIFYTDSTGVLHRLTNTGSEFNTTDSVSPSLGVLAN